ncbi:phosphatidylglycerophosphatase A family protein [Paracandidimonas soli]|uniref:Phosphatidylglycerophosphatase A n=1 Tax=Paracandidimonas soli TaxID=1917182 RepID=A0A4R3VHH8_9BURK|nr:phosphatidylglycerophosphatase A [Paracandidimonas soli]TCV03224.1 phosphatidylglycerophosphatase [Paracandidimonas soli]
MGKDSTVSHSPETEVRPTLAWMWRSPWRILAFGFGSGLIRPAPGTWGTLFGWLLWQPLSLLPDVAVLCVLLAGFVLGCAACQATGKELGRPDDSGMVWDEITAFWLVLWLVPGGILAQALAFAVFRMFDIIKPPPIRFFDRRLKNGFGVMWDDIVAAGYSLLVMAVLVRLGILA